MNCLSVFAYFVGLALKGLREDQNHENEMCSGMKYVLSVVKICSQKCEWLLLILFLLKNKLFHKYQVLVI